MKTFGTVIGLVWVVLSPGVCTGQTAQRPSECEAAALEATLTFANDPPGENVVAINYRNVSESACTLNGGIGAMFDNWHEGHNIWAKECRNCDAAGTSQPVAPLLLAPGESGHFLLRWKNTSDGTSTCEDADGFNTNNVTVVAPSLLAHVCSVVDERSFLPGTFPSGAEDGSGSSGIVESLPSVELTAPDSKLYAGDSFPFRGLIKDTKGQLPLDEKSCPITFIRTRDASGNTMFHQVSWFFPKCRLSPATGQDRTIEMELRAPGLGVLNKPGTTSVQFYVLAGPANAARVALAASNQLPMKIVDPATIPPVWGPESAGLAISLVLDKRDYRTGEDVPLRINLENFRAAQEIGSGELPCGAGVTIEVRDSAGALVTERGFGWLCTGHGWQTKYPLGKPVLVPRITLSAVRLLPDRPGTYIVTATWHAYSFGPGQPSEDGGRSPQSFAAGPWERPLQPYATVHSQPVTFRIVPEPY